MNHANENEGNDVQVFTSNELMIGTKDMLIHEISFQLMDWKKQQQENGIRSKILYICNSELIAFSVMRQIQKRVFHVLPCTMLRSSTLSATSTSPLALFSASPTLHQVFTSDLIFTTATNVLQWMDEQNGEFSIFDFDIILDEVYELHASESSALHAVLNRLDNNTQSKRVVIGLTSDVLFTAKNEPQALANIIHYLLKRLKVERSASYLIKRDVVSCDAIVKSEDVTLSRHDHISVVLNEEQNIVLNQIVRLLLDLKDYILRSFNLPCLERLVPLSFSIGTFEFEEWITDTLDYLLQTGMNSVWYCLTKLRECHYAMKILEEEPLNPTEAVMGYLAGQQERLKNVSLLSTNMNEIQNKYLSSRIDRSAIIPELRSHSNHSQSSLLEMSREQESTTIEDISSIFKKWMPAPSRPQNVADINPKAQCFLTCIQKNVLDNNYARTLVIVSHEATGRQLLALLLERFQSKLQASTLSHQAPVNQNNLNKVTICTRTQYHQMCVVNNDQSMHYDLIVNYDAPSRHYHTHFFEVINTDHSSVKNIHIFNLNSEAEQQLNAANRLIDALQPEVHRILKRPRNEDDIDLNSSPPHKRPRYEQPLLTSSHQPIARESTPYVPADNIQPKSELSVAASDPTSEASLIIQKRWRIAPRFTVTYLKTKENTALFQATLRFRGDNNKLMESQGIGKNKKDAKKEASIAMLKIFKNMGIIQEADSIRLE